MPSSALTVVGADHVLPLEGISAALVELATAPLTESVPPVPNRMDKEADIAEMDFDAMQDDERPGTPSGYSCPECHGSLFEIQEAEVVRYRCRVGHAYGVESLLAHQGHAVESALWTAMMALKERAVLSRRMADRLRARGGDVSAGRFSDQANDADVRAGVILEVLRNLGLAAGQEAERALETREARLLEQAGD
jgi:two-component system chemotaxis response regulator CheB